MGRVANAREVVGELNRVRQIRQYTPQPVPADAVNELLEIARWTGSSRNSQPWRFIVVTEPDELRRLSEIRPAINWVAGAPLAIAIVLDGASATSEAYDEGRISERLLIGAHLLGLGGGVAWFGDAAQQEQAKQILGIPPQKTARSMVVIGSPASTKDHRPNPVAGGRKPLTELVSYGRLGQTAP